MAYIPEQVVRIENGKQIGTGIGTDASAVKYNDTTVEAELNQINNDLSENLKCTILTSSTFSNVLKLDSNLVMTNGITRDYEIVSMKLENGSYDDGLILTSWYNDRIIFHFLGVNSSGNVVPQSSSGQLRVCIRPILT